MTRETADGMDAVHDGIRRLGPGGTTGVTTTGGAIVGATIDIVTPLGGYVTIDGRTTTTGAIGGGRAGCDIDETIAIDLSAVLKFGIAGDKLSQLRDTIPVPKTEGVKQL